jgi:uncharacterized protein YabE (DUF348 family)
MPGKLGRFAIVIGLAIATLGYGALEKHVTVQIEGHPVAVATWGGSVADVLTRAGVHVGPLDRVIPAESTPVRDGSVIEVRRAKPVVLLLDGKPRRVIVTGLTIEEVLEEVRLRNSLVDTVRPSRSSRVSAGMTIVYDQAVDVTVVHDDQHERVITNAPTVAEVIRELKISLGKQDRIEPAAVTSPRPGLTIKVLRVGYHNEVSTIHLSYQTILRRDRHLEYGLHKLVQGGLSGIEVIHYRSKYVDGVRVMRTTLSDKVLRQPRARVIAIGAGFPGCVCDRGTQSGKATWYSQADGLSAAHRTLPLGTVVRVVNLANGKWVNVVIRDRGPYGDDRIIDLSDEAFRRIASLGTGVIRVRIYW